MRIGIDIRALMDGKPTGVREYIVRLLLTLFSLDRKNEYILFANGFADQASRIKLFDFPNVHYRIFHYPNRLLVPLMKFCNYPRIKTLFGDVGLIFSPHWRSLPVNKNIPLIVTFHDLSYEVNPDFFTFRQRLWHKFMDYQKAAAQATRLIAVSESTRSDLMRLYNVAAEKIFVIPSGVESSKVAEQVPGIPKEYFLSLATFEPRKNLQAIVAAYEIYLQKSRYKRKLVLAGSSGWKGKLTIKPTLSNHITQIRNISDAQKNYLYAHTFAFLAPSFYEGFGFPILEAAQAGAPVITSSCTSLREIASGFSLLVNPFRPRQIAQAMTDLEIDRELYCRLQNRGENSASEFKWYNTAVATLKLFESFAK